MSWTVNKKRIVENLGERMRDGSFLLLLATAFVLAASH